MQRPKTTLIALGSVAALAMLVVLTPTGGAIAQETRALLVEVVNTPDVNVRAPVLIGNAPSAPVPVFDVFSSSSAREPFRAHLLCSSTGLGCSDKLTVPAGKLLIIETYSGHCNAPFTTTTILSSIEIPHSHGSIAKFHFPMEQSVTGTGALVGRHHALTSAVRLYADPATDVTFEFVRNVGAVSTWVCEASISGLFLECGLGTGCTVF